MTESLFNLVLRLLPCLLVALWGLHWLMEHLKRYFVQRDKLQHALYPLCLQILLWPFSAAQWSALGNLWGDLKQWPRAQRCYHMALRLRPQWIEAHLGLGTAALVLADDWRRADFHFLQAYVLRRGTPQHCEPPLPDSIQESPPLTETLFLPPEQRLIWQQQWRWLAQFYPQLEECPDSNTAQRLIRPQAQEQPLLRAQNWPDIERRYQTGLVAIDDLLSPTSLQALLECCQKSSFWHHLYSNHYLGAYLDDGLSNPLLYQLAQALRAALPGIFADTRLVYLWAFKCHSAHGRGPGVALHHDSALVNVNLWLTPDTANQDPTTGGICVYLEEPPREWDLERYALSPQEMEEWIQNTGAQAHCIPYRQNRAVIFNSRLLHATQAYHFGTEYPQQRINLTLLFGQQPLRYHPKHPLPEQLKNKR